VVRQSWLASYLTSSSSASTVDTPKQQPPDTPGPPARTAPCPQIRSSGARGRRDCFCSGAGTGRAIPMATTRSGRSAGTGRVFATQSGHDSDAKNAPNASALGHNQPRHHTRDTRAKARLDPRVGVHVLFASGTPDPYDPPLHCDRIPNPRGARLTETSARCACAPACGRLASRARDAGARAELSDLTVTALPLFGETCISVVSCAAGHREEASPPDQPGPT
jgi:hypothetical protein